MADPMTTKTDSVQSSPPPCAPRASAPFSWLKGTSIAVALAVGAIVVGPSVFAQSVDGVPASDAPFNLLDAASGANANQGVFDGAPLLSDADISQALNPIEINVGQVAQATESGTTAVPTITVRAGKHAEFDRFVFDWEQAVDYSIDRQGDQVTISFDAPGRADLAAVRFMRLSFGETIRDVGGANGLALTMTVPEGSELRDFRLEQKVVLDIVASSERVAEQTSAQVEAAVEPVAPPPVPEAPPATQQPVVVTPQPPAETATAVAGAEPVLDADSAVVASPETDIETVTATAVNDGDDIGAAIIAADATIDLIEVTDGTIEAADGEDAADSAVTVIRIDPNVPVGAVVFTRADALWAVFPATGMSVAPLVQGPAAGQLRRADVYAVEGGTAYRFPLPPGLHPRVKREGQVWEIALSPTVTPSPTARIEIEGTDVSAGKRLSVGIEVTGQTIEMIDPTIGDRLVLVPALEPGRAVREARRLPQLEFLPAVQGVVIRPLINELVVDAGTETVKVQAPDGLLLSADRQALLAAAPNAPETVDGLRLFDITTWQRGPIAAFDISRSRLQEQTAAQNPEDRAAGYIDLARLYFAHGFGAEARGLIRLAIEASPNLSEQPEVLALRGAATALEGGGRRALNDLNIQALEIHPEAALWRGLALARLGRWTEAGQEFARSGDLVLEYPSGLYREVAGLMAESLLFIGEIDAAQAIVDDLDRRGQLVRVNRSAINFLRGDILQRQGEVEAGQALWQQVADSGTDQLYRVKAQYGLIEAGLATGAMAPEEAIEILEQLRFAWRGDTLELAILRRLGTLYLDTGSYFAGFELLRRSAGYFPGSQQSQVLTGDMAQAFRRLFVDGDSDELSPVQAYGLFDEFRELNPIGETGDKVIQRLAERLIEVDLLGEAGEILQQQVEFRVTGLERARLGARLAGVRLLDDLPELALEALEISDVSESLPVNLIEERTLLAGRAYQQMGEPDQALASISGLSTAAADRLRADIGWRFNRWSVAASALNGLLPPAPETGLPLAPGDAQLVMNSAVALALANQQPGLNRLRETYGDAMALSPLADAFRVVTRQGSGVLLADLDTLQSQVSEVDLFSEFLGSYSRIQDEAAVMDDNLDARAGQVDQTAEVPTN
ncbi:MAG: tetratricopeptide repeat protein [Alphaproteobacteria bacterium]|nr:tetratricopeptide repeat protein [Alphaproteobacteria bacterium SS10]